MKRKKLITVNDVLSMKGQSHVVVGPEDIITPAAKDLLDELRIKIDRESVREQSPEPATPVAEKNGQNKNPHIEQIRALIREKLGKDTSEIIITENVQRVLDELKLLGQQDVKHDAGAAKPLFPKSTVPFVSNREATVNTGRGDVPPSFSTAHLRQIIVSVFGKKKGYNRSLLTSMIEREGCTILDSREYETQNQWFLVVTANMDSERLTLERLRFGLADLQRSNGLVVSITPVFTDS